MNTYVSESDLGIPCENTKCTAQAHYVITVKMPEGDMVKLYCTECTEALVAGAAKILRDNGDGQSLHEYVETEYLLTGGVIHA